MNKQRLTEWFRADVKPRLIGVYQVDDEDGMDGEWFAFWDGYSFGYRDASAKYAYWNRLLRTDCLPRVKWRGLAEDPGL